MCIFKEKRAPYGQGGSKEVEGRGTQGPSSGSRRRPAAGALSAPRTRTNLRAKLEGQEKAGSLLFTTKRNERHAGSHLEVTTEKGAGTLDKRILVRAHERVTMIAVVETRNKIKKSRIGGVSRSGGFSRSGTLGSEDEGRLIMVSRFLKGDDIINRKKRMSNLSLGDTSGQSPIKRVGEVRNLTERGVFSRKENGAGLSLR